MDRSTRKILGLAMMMGSVFLILFGLHGAELGLGGPAGTALLAGGLVAFVAGLILYAVMRDI